MILAVGVLAVSGALGCASRAAVRDLALRRGAHSWQAILAINLLGALAMGAVATMTDRSTGRIGAIVAVGFLGGWTTYSAFALDVVSLCRHRRAGAAALLWALTIFGAPAIAWLGAVAARGVAS